MSDDTFDFTRRKALTGLGIASVASTGASVGTSAFLNNSIE